jgi:recombinational DNA repair ATPase RecF
MYAQKLSLRNYRNIVDEQISFTPEVNLLYGENAQGKTNVLEALYFYARGKSFRGATDKEQTLFGCNGFVVPVFLPDGGLDGAGCFVVNGYRLGAGGIGLSVFMVPVDPGQSIYF